MRVAKIKGLICLVAVLAVISTTVIVATDSEIEQNENQSITSTVMVTTQPTTVVTTTEKVEETTEKVTEPTTERATEKVTEKVTEPKTEKPTKTATTKPVETTKPKETTEKLNTSEALYSASKFMNMGVIYWNGWRWTWYSERVLPGNGLRIPGRHADSSGYICDENDYICLSSSSLSKGTVIATPFGKNGKVYDCGCASDTIDVYVNW